MNRALFLVLIVPLFLMAYLFSQEIDLSKVPNNQKTFTSYIKFVKYLAPSDSAYIVLQRAAGFYTATKKFSQASKIFEENKKLFPNYVHQINEIQAILDAPDEPIKHINLGPTINSSSDEFMPVPTFDGDKLFYTTDRLQDSDGEEILISDFNPITNLWNKSYSISSPIKTRKNESVSSITTDENTIILFGNYKGGLGKGDIFYTEKKFSGWKEVIPFPRPINSEYFDGDATILTNNKIMIFVSDRPNNVTKYLPKDSCYLGSYWGNTDIYISQKIDSIWREPINLGSVINTNRAERFPFIHPDLRTLYFCSEGLPGLGKLDIFMSTRKNDTSWNEWNEPINVGKFINTPEDETNFIFSSNPDFAYISKQDKEGLGGLDIYRIYISDKLKPLKLFRMTGFVRDSNGFKLEANISWEEVGNKFNSGTTRTNPQYGSFHLFLPFNKEFKIVVSKKNYTSFECLINTSNGIITNDTITINSLTPLKSDIRDEFIKFYQALDNPDSAYFKLDGISYSSGAFYFNEGKLVSIPELDNFAEFLKSEMDIKVRLAGHADIKGSYESNLTLSIERAQGVADYLIKKGIDKDRFFIMGFSNTIPIASNKTEEGRRKNRRVEFNLLK